MANNISNRSFTKDTRNCKRNQELLSDEMALRDEILKLKRQVMVLRRTNEQNLVKFRKYEDEAKRKDREIEQLMDPRKNADVTKVLSTKGAAILMTLKDQNNALIQMVLNKDVQIRRLLAEMKMSKLYASTRKNVSFKEEIARLKNLLVKAQEKLRENLDKENEEKSMCANESSFLELSSSPEQSSPRDSEELRSVIRTLEAHLKYSNDLLNKKDQKISLLTDELIFLKKLLQHKTSKNKSFDCHSIELQEYPINDTHSIPQARYDSSITPQASKISATELVQLFQKSASVENKTTSSSAPASSTRLPSSNDIMQKHKSLSNITDNDNWKDSKTESSKVMKTDATLLHDIAVGEDANKMSIISKLEKVEKVRERKKILTKRREPKKRISKKVAKRKKFYENDKKSQLMLQASESEKNEKEVYGQIITEIFKKMDSKENEDVKVKAEEIFSKAELHDFRTSLADIEQSKGIQKGKNNKTINCDLHDANKQPAGLNSNHNLSKDLLTDSISGGSSEIVAINSAIKKENSGRSDDEMNSITSRKENNRQSFDSNSESEDGYPMKQQIQQVQVEVQIDSILAQSDSDESENSTGENSHQREFTEKGGDNCAPDDDDNNNDDDNDVITR